MAAAASRRFMAPGLKARASRRHRIAPAMDIMLGEIQLRLQKDTLDKKLKILGAFTMPADFEPTRYNEPLAIEESAIAVLVTPFKLNWTAQPVKEYQQLLPAENYIVCFPDQPLRKRIFYDPNYQNAPWSYDWTFGGSTHLTTAAAGGYQCLTTSWAIPTSGFTYKPHGDYLFSGYDDDLARYLWVDQVNRGPAPSKTAQQTYSRITFSMWALPLGTASTSAQIKAVFTQVATPASGFNIYTVATVKLWRYQNGNPEPVDQRTVQVVVDSTGTAVLVIQPNAYPTGAQPSLPAANNRSYFDAEAAGFSTGYPGFIQSDYYDIEIIPVDPNTLFGVIGVYEAGWKVTSSGYCSNYRHNSVEEIFSFIPRISEYRALGDAMLLTNMSAPMNPEGEIATAQTRKPTDWYDFLVAGGNGSSLFAKVADYKGHFLGPNMDGGYFWCAPHDILDLKYQDDLWEYSSSGPTGQPAVVDAKFPLKPHRQPTVCAISTLNDGNNSGQQGSGLGADFWVTHATSFEYLTDDLLTDVAWSDFTETDFRDAFELLKWVPRFTSNRMHWSDIIGTIGQALSWGKPYIMAALGNVIDSASAAALKRKRQ